MPVPEASGATAMENSPEPLNPELAEKLDFLPQQQLATLQLERLQQMASRAYQHVESVRHRWDALGLDPSQIHALTDLHNYPFACKQDLRDGYPYGLLACSLKEVSRIHASSGTTGQPIVVAYTQRDLDVWSSAMVRTLRCYGIRADDILQNAYGYGLFTGGLGVHYGAEHLGATVVPTSGGNTDRQIQVMQEFGATVICCTPSYFLHLVDRAQQIGIDFRQLPLRVGVFGAEPWTEAMRERIERLADIRAFDIYGLSEIVGPGVAAECKEQKGLHIFEDHFFPEIIDPKSGTVLPDGEEGELVLTTLSKEAMPLIRYRTGDITTLLPEACGCGRTLRRIERINRRSDDMLIVRGVNVYPAQIEAALLSVKGTLPHYQIELTRQDDLDQVAVQVEVEAEFAVNDQNPLHAEVTQAMKKAVGLRVEVQLLNPQTLPRSEGKAKRVIDRRFE